MKQGTAESATTPAAMDRPVFAIVMMLVAVGLWALHDALSKELALSFAVPQILFIRSGIALTLVSAFLLAVRGPRAFRTRRPGLNALRGLLGCGAIGLFIAALPMQPLVSTFAIIAAAPIFITVLSVPLLGEPVGLRRWLTAIGGFAVILFMLQPGGGVAPLAAAMLVVSNLLYAVTMILSRIIGRLDDAGTMTVYTMLVFIVANGAIAPFVWTPPSTQDWLLFLVIGALAAVALYTMTVAFRVGAPSLVAPFEYTGIAWAALLGWLMWGEVPTWVVTAGALALVVCGLYMLHRERLAARRAHPVAADVFGHEGPSGDADRASSAGRRGAE